MNQFFVISSVIAIIVADRQPALYPSKLFSRNGQETPAQIFSRGLPSLFLTWDRMTLLSTQHPAQTQHWPALDKSHPTSALMSECRGVLKWGGGITYPGSLLEVDCLCSWASRFRWETSSADLLSSLRRSPFDKGLSLWTGQRSATWRPRVHSEGHLLGRCSPSWVPVWWASGVKIGRCRES